MNCQLPKTFPGGTSVAAHITIVLAPWGGSGGGGAAPSVVKLTIGPFAVTPAIVFETTRQ